MGKPGNRASTNTKVQGNGTMTMTYRNALVSAAFALLATATLMASTAAILAGAAGAAIA